MSTALVTGSSTGIGYATALELARGGHTVVATMRNPAGAPELKQQADRQSLPITVVAMDVNSDESVAAGFAEAERTCGPLDVLVNNAGVGRGGAIEDVSIAQFRDTMETNFFGALRCIKTVMPGMRQRRSGCIVNITSVAGRLASAAQGSYCSSKFALEALSEVLAQEARLFGIRVAIVEPGVIATPIFDKGQALADSPYPGQRRLFALFVASLSAVQVPPSVVGQKIREIVDQGILGPLYYFDSTRVNLGLLQHDVSVVWDLAPHDLSIMDDLIKERPEAVVATGGQHLNGHADMAFITIYFPSNVVAHVNVNWLSPVKVRTTLIGGQHKMLVWNDLEADEKIKVYDKGVKITGSEAAYDLLVSYRSGDVWAPKCEQTEALKVELEYLIDCISSSTTPINDG